MLIYLWRAQHDKLLLCIIGVQVEVVARNYIVEIRWIFHRFILNFVLSSFPTPVDSPSYRQLLRFFTEITRTAWTGNKLLISTRFAKMTASPTWSRNFPLSPLATTRTYYRVETRPAHKGATATVRSRIFNRVVSKSNRFRRIIDCYRNNWFLCPSEHDVWRSPRRDRTTAKLNTLEPTGRTTTVTEINNRSKRFDFNATRRTCCGRRGAVWTHPPPPRPFLRVRCPAECAGKRGSGSRFRFWYTEKRLPISPFPSARFVSTVFSSTSRRSPVFYSIPKSSRNRKTLAEPVRNRLEHATVSTEIKQTLC